MSYFGIPIRNGLPIGLGSVAPLASGGGSPFSPLSLFAGGAPGAWYDPSDYTTLFQDSAGTTPVTAVEQPVGLMLDKSQGLVLGSELVPSTIPSISGAGWTTNGTSITATSSTASGTIALTASTPSTKFYQVTFTASGLSGATSYMVFSSGVSAVTKRINTAKSYSFIVPGQGTAAFEIAPYEGTAFSVTISNISVKELAGNHAFQATSASRPVLSARYNLLTKTEDFSDNTVWAKVSATVTANTIVAPDGTMTADTLTTITSGGYVSVGVNAVSSTLSVYVKQGVGTRFSLGTSGSSSDDFAVFNLSTGSVVSTGANNVSATIVSAGNGWNKLSVTRSATATNTTIYIGFFLSSASVNDFHYIWGASLVPANQSTLPYQRVNTATDYNSTGFLPYLKFDGVDDSLSTNSISFTSTDKMSVFAGVRKLAAQDAIVLESSVDFVANNGAFVISSGTSLGNYFGLRGSAFAAYNSTFTAPQTSVQSVIFNIAGSTIADEIKPRVNGAVPTLTVATAGPAGTGNFGNYPLYIGRRGGSSLPFNGQMYSMIIVGKAVTAGELSSTETYVNQKTGAY